MKLEEVCQLFIDGDWIESKDQSHSGIRLIQTGNVGNGQFLEKEGKEKYISEATFERLKCTEIYGGDILISRLPDPIGRACIVPNKNERMITAVDCTICRVNDNLILPRYLCYFLQSSGYYNQLHNSVAGTTRQRISRKNLGKVEIVIPSFEMQNKIVSKLDILTRLISDFREILLKLDLLVKSRFVEMFGDPIINSRGWKTEQAEKHIDLLSGFPFDSSKYTDNGIYICGGLIIMPQRIDWNDCKYWSSIEGYEEYILQENDIVMALDRPWISEGFKVAMIDGSHLPALLIQRTARIRAIDINQQYLFYCFIMGGFDKHCSITGSLVPHISPKDIRSFTIMLPPLDLQNQFADFVQQVDKLKVAS